MSDDARPVRVPIGRAELEGDLRTPEGPGAVILFAHGSGSSRHSPRNRYVAEALGRGGFATLLLDLLTVDEESVDMRTGHLRFDIGLLAERLVIATDWLRQDPLMSHSRVGYFGASTGAGAALVAASQRSDIVFAVVSRGGRPDLAGASLRGVTAPTLLIVGGKDVPVIDFNREALPSLPAESRLEIVPGATHLFEEPGALEEVTRLARGWFERYAVHRQSAA